MIEDGDTEEDKEARALLNKFLGASVLMSGMESMVPREITTIVGKPTSQKQVNFISIWTTNEIIVRNALIFHFDGSYVVHIWNREHSELS